MSITYEAINIPDPESTEEKLQRLLNEIKELEMTYYNFDNREDKDDELLISLENELTTKKTEYTEAGGSFD
tara:strand:+ start:319 stop:531 length:213 start_codon:yes stop_codon:yes gene_type:complete